MVLKNTFVPLDKQSKKAQRAAVRADRALWQGVKLCPRIMRKRQITAARGGGWSCRKNKKGAVHSLTFIV